MTDWMGDVEQSRSVLRFLPKSIHIAIEDLPPYKTCGFMTSQAKFWQSIHKVSQALPLTRRFWVQLGKTILPSESADYQAWRYRFLNDRLRLSMWIAALCFMSFVAQDFYQFYPGFAQFEQKITQIFGDPDLARQFRDMELIGNLLTGILLCGCLVLHSMNWGKRHPKFMFLMFSWTFTLTPQIVDTIFRLPSNRFIIWLLVFLAQATLIPVYWTLHLLAQLVALVYYISVNPLLGLTEIAGKSVYSPIDFIYLFWLCLIFDLAVFLYERLQRAEFESRRELRVFLHAVSHDLKNPVMGTSVVFQNLLKKSSNGMVTVSESVIERLLQGSDRQLALINSLLEAHQAEVQEIVLHRQPVQLHTLVESVLSDLQSVIHQSQIELVNRLRPDLPWVHADPVQLWRVFSNLMSNAVKHNPSGITVTLEAEIISPGSKPYRSVNLQRSNSSLKMMRCLVQDNGIGIPPEQTNRLFELYARGTRARYMPGLGLGLYLCRQIITAHGGHIGVMSTVNQGSTFWFTLPLVDLENQPPRS
jgi:signal transduction histidine kinase